MSLLLESALRRAISNSTSAYAFPGICSLPPFGARHGCGQDSQIFEGVSVSPLTDDFCKTAYYHARQLKASSSDARSGKPMVSSLLASGGTLLRISTNQTSAGAIMSGDKRLEVFDLSSGRACV